MITFAAEYDRRGSYGYFEEIHSIVTASTRSEALGLLLNQYPETDVCWWNLTPLSLEAGEIYTLHRRES